MTAFAVNKPGRLFFRDVRSASAPIRAFMALVFSVAIANAANAGTQPVGHASFSDLFSIKSVDETSQSKATDGKEAVEKMQARWNDRLKAVRTAHLRYRVFLWAASPTQKNGITREEVIAALQKVSTSDSATVLRSATDPLVEKAANGISLIFNWSRVEILDAGSKTRENVLDGIDPSEAIRRGEYSLSHEGGQKRAFIRLRSGPNAVAVADANSYISIPSITKDAIDKSGLIHEADNLIVVLGSQSGSHRNIICDPRNNVLVDEIKNGPMLLREVRQAGFAEISKGAWMPELIFRAVYKDGLVTQWMTAIMDEAQVNGQIDESVFVLSIPAKTLLCDVRPDPPKSYITPKPIGDLYSYVISGDLDSDIRQPQALTSVPEKTRLELERQSSGQGGALLNRSSLSILVNIMVCVLLAMLIWMARKKHLTSRL